MKKNIGNALALYPTPLVVVGTMVNGKPNWVLVGHLGIMGPGELLDGLGHPVGVSRVGVAHDQRFHPWAFPKLMHLASTSPIFKYS